MIVVNFVCEGNPSNPMGIGKVVPVSGDTAGITIASKTSLENRLSNLNVDAVAALRTEVDIDIPYNDTEQEDPEPQPTAKPEDSCDEEYSYDDVVIETTRVVNEDGSVTITTREV